MSIVSTTDESITPTRTPLGGIGVLFTAGLLAVAAGSFGVVAGVTLCILWAVSPGVYSVAIAYLLLTVSVPDPTFLQLSGVGTGTIIILLGATSDLTGRTAMETVVGVALLWGVTFLVYRWLESVWLTAVLLVALVSILVYGFHRYELVRLDLVEATE